MKKIIKYFLLTIVIFVAVFAVFLVYATFADYRPDEQTILSTSEEPGMLSDTLEINLMAWNIGYCGLNAEMDFFYDGGEHVRPDRETSKRNLDGVRDFLKSTENIDFFLLQEVDVDSKRSYGTNQFDSIVAGFPDFETSYSKNYDVFFVPQPLFNPMGRVNSGLMTLSKFGSESSVRYSFPGNYSWPLGLFFLDRCFVMTRYAVQNEKELIVINTHNSAYDDGSLRDQQMSYLKEIVKDEFSKGNYVIVGGDWNQCPPDFKPNFKDNLMDNESRKDIASTHFADWTWAYDSTTPTNRRVVAPYDKSKTLTTVIDFFLLSPNIELKKVETKSLDFQYSDHNPVFLKLKLK